MQVRHLNGSAVTVLGLSRSRLTSVLAETFVCGNGRITAKAYGCSSIKARRCRDGDLDVLSEHMATQLVQTLRRGEAVAASCAFHLLGTVVLLAVVGGGRVSLAPQHQPGTPRGTRVELSYSPGGPSSSTQSGTLSTLIRQSKQATRSTAPQTAPLRNSAAAPQEKGTGAGGTSSLGDGDFHIAQLIIHPRPEPDLSALPRGGSGNVVVDIVIDQTGKVSAVSLVTGLSKSINETVLSVLQGWTFTPATRNGQDVASEQEIIVHYERK